MQWLVFSTILVSSRVDGIQGGTRHPVSTSMCLPSYIVMILLHFWVFILVLMSPFSF